MLKNDCFKGWYFKCRAKDKTIAFITAQHITHHIQTASLQIITDDSAFNIPFNFLKYCEKPLCVNIGNCMFSEEGIKLDIQSDELRAAGELKFYNLSPIMYDIMGPFRFVPFMQCRHSVYSMRHRIEGQINLNGKTLKFQNGNGYIEGDCGRSFPKKYIWTQCCFENSSLMLSVADIPLAGFHFTGIIGIVLLCGKEYRLATYLGAKLEYIGENTVIVKQGDYELYARLIQKKDNPLYAPQKGKMARIIHESASCRAHYRFLLKGRCLCEFISEAASFEFEY